MPLNDACLDMYSELALEAVRINDMAFADGLPYDRLLALVDAWLATPPGRSLLLSC